MTNQGSDIQHPKLRGEWAELRFMARAAEHGLCVAKPWGDTAPYDFLVERHGNFFRVQVKCTIYKRSLSYECDITASHVRYSSDRLDFFAIYVIEPDVWYIIPFAAIDGRTRLILSPHRTDSKYEPYREAWPLLRGEPAAPDSPPADSASPHGSDSDPCSDSNQNNKEYDAQQASPLPQNPFSKIKWNPIWRPSWMPRR